jgi:hypothetical protein
VRCGLAEPGSGEPSAAASPHEAEDQAFVDAISRFGDEADDEDEE